MDNAKPIRILALIGLVVKIIQTVLVCAVYLVPQPILLRLMNYASIEADFVWYPLNFVPPLIALGVYALLFYVLMRQLKTGSRNASGAVIGTGIYILVISPVCSFVFNIIRNAFFARFYGAEALAALGTVNVALNYVSILTGAAAPALMAAAAMLWYRQRYLLPQTGGQP